MALSTLCPAIDAATNGDLQIGTVTELCGEEDVGKTCLSAQLGLSGGQGCAAYMYTKTFPAQRLHELAKHLVGEDKVRQALENVHTWHSCDPDELGKLLTEINNFIKSKANTPTPVKLMVIDSLTDFYWDRYPNTKEGYIEKTDLMRAVGFGLKRMAQQNHIAIVLCNGVLNSYDPHNVKNFITSNRIVRPKLLGVLEKNIPVRWIMAKEFNSEGGIYATFKLPGDEQPRCAYHIAPNGIVSSS